MQCKILAYKLKRINMSEKGVGLGSYNNVQ